MKKRVRLAAATASLLVCVLAGSMLLVYTRPMEDQVYDLSMSWEGEASPDDWVYDQKGWTVFTQEGGVRTLLAADGLGGFTGLAWPGQTLYFSRPVEEGVDNPILCVGAAESSVAVFLDSALLYTDCPEQDNRVGYLNLPMLGWRREEPVVVPLPGDCQGKNLTVAQGTSPVQGRGVGKAYPLAVTLYSGYAYESRLIAESFQTAVSASLTFSAGAALMILFILQTLRGEPDLKTVCGALMAFFWLTGHLREASFARYYFDASPVDVVGLTQALSLTLLLVFLSAHMTGRRRVLLWVLTGLQGMTVAVNLLLELTGNVSFAADRAGALAGLAGLLAALVCGLWECKKGNRFYLWVCALTGLGIAACAVAAAASALRSGPLAATLWQQLTLGAFGYFLTWLSILVTAAALCGAIAEAIREEIARRTQARLMAQRAEMTQSSYEAMRSQHEQVMMLRHDMTKHLRLLRQMTQEPKTADYLDELIGAEEKIRPVVQCGNEILNIILNSKLTAAADAGIGVELLRMQAPPKLPLTDAELCSLVVNLMDNAIEAAGAPGVERRYIKLDLHIKNDFFAFICENAAAPGWADRPPGPDHGLGLEIVRQVVHRYGDLSRTEYGDGFYKVTVVLPLRQPLK